MEKKNTATVTKKQYYRVKKKSPEPIRPEDISVEVKPRIPSQRSQQTTEGPNFLALAILWAHFKACEEKLLTEDQPAPWRVLAEKTDNRKWVEFLRKMITDTSWTDWIQDEEEVKKRSLKAYGAIEEG